MLTFNFSKIKLDDRGVMLDLGCGEGRHIFGVMQAFPNIQCIGLDPNLDSLDKSLADLKNNFEDISLVVIGKIKRNGHTSRLIKKLGIQDRVSFKTGLTKNEIAKEYASSSIAVVSSLYEGFGYPVIEAMSCEIPLVATNSSSIPELVDKYATLIEPKNVTELSNTLTTIFNNYEKYRDIAVRGRAHTIENFNWLKITEEYENIIHTTIKKFKKC